ncbi:MAG: helix-turn-helix transcriptional regulator [Oscillospiraceae bacterium]|nr:helix-turn-helix transcriptional regulator [Oscillospiraceae bacterium]MDD7293786.1 helix-turn-helix transcriptional regulator [Oscillospiraceae bacterium]MDY2509277.1 helix-turn-helix transcriptional regulator [Ruminococcus callidus]
MIFSDKLRLLRSQAGLSQEGLADKLHVSRQSVSKWESGISFPEIEKLIAISELFDVSIDALLKETTADALTTENMDRLVLRFLGSSQAMHSISQQLVTIMQDGKIDAQEALQMEQIMCALDHIIKDIATLKQTFYANRNVIPADQQPSLPFSIENL